MITVKMITKITFTIRKRIPAIIKKISERPLEDAVPCWSTIMHLISDVTIMYLISDVRSSKDNDIG